MSLLGRIGKFAKSPEGKKLMNQAQQMAKDPATKKKIDDARQRLMHRDTQERKQTTKPQASGIISFRRPRHSHGNVQLRKDTTEMAQLWLIIGIAVGALGVWLILRAR